jgi:hypothetical protein
MLFQSPGKSSEFAFGHTKIGHNAGGMSYDDAENKGLVVWYKIGGLNTERDGNP